MKKLKNGAWIIDLKTRDHKCHVVLARWDKPTGVEWVTWVVDEEGNAFWGHYFTDLRSALEDYENRG